MNNIVKITLWGQTVGYIKWDDSNWKTTGSIFQFDKEFINKGLDISPILMPVSDPKVRNCLPIHTYNPKGQFRGLPPVFGASLPDHWGTSIFNAWAKEHLKDNKTNPVDMLSFIGTRGMGALEYEPSIIKNDKEAFDVDVNKLYDFAKQILAEKSKPEFKADKELLWQDLIKLGTSPGGKRPKALIAINKQTNTVKSGQAMLPPGYEHYILKYDNETEQFPYAKVEYAYYKLCTNCGIKMMETTLRQFEHATHFITKRFDRDSNEKIHMQSLRSITGGCDSYEQALNVTQNLCRNYSNTEQLFRMMVFNILSGNIDDHDNNFSFLMNKQGIWTLAPAYDIIYSIDPSQSEFQKGQFMSVNGKTSEISIKDILQVAQRFSIRKPESIIENTLDNMSTLPDVLKDLEISNPTIKMITEELNKKYQFLGKHFTISFDADNDPAVPHTLTEFERKAVIAIQSKHEGQNIFFQPVKRILHKGKPSGTIFKVTIGNENYTYVTDNETKDISFAKGHFNQGQFQNAKTWKTIDGKPASYTPTRVLSIDNKKKLVTGKGF